MANALQILGICGWFGDTPEVEPRSELLRQVAAQPWLRSFPDQTGQFFSLAAPGGSIWSNDAGLVVAVVGCPYWRSAKSTPNQSSSASPASIGALYRDLGEDFLDALGGEFSIAIYDQRARTGLIAVDRFARRPCYWSRVGNRLVFGASADAVVAHSATTSKVNRQGIYHYLFFHMIPSPGTIYEGVYKLRPGSRLRFRDASVDAKPYWMPAFQESPKINPKSGGKQLLGLLERAMLRCEDGDKPTATGAFLSGGLDSSTVAGILARLCPAADSYSIGFRADGYDEIGYARIVADHFGLTPHEYYVTPEDVLTAIPQVAAAYDEPFGNSSALPALFCARLAKANGNRRLLAGDGGDELFAGNERYLKQQLFERYRQLPAQLRHRLIEPVVRAMPDGLPFIGKVQSFVDRALIPLPERLHSYNFLQHLGIESVVHPALQTEIDRDQPSHLEREIYYRLDKVSALNRMLYLDWHHTLADNDLRKVSRMCELTDIPVCYPLLDDEIVAFSMTIPSAQKIRAGRLRAYYKQAMRDFLPAEILTKGKHGFGLPFGVWMTRHTGLKELVQENLQRLARRQIVREGFFDDVLALHQHGHAAYYGELIWVLIVLEMWFTSRNIQP